MEPSIFEDIFKDSQLPAIVCEDDERLTVVFANRIATLMTRPSFTVDRLAGLSGRLPLRDFMAFHLPDEDRVISRALRDSGSIARYSTAILAPDGTQIRMVLSAHLAQVGNKKYAVFHFSQDERSEDFELQSGEMLFSILNISYHAEDVGSAIQTIISIAGSYVDVSRVYIFEDLGNEYTTNSYEWCSPGTQPMIDELQFLSKADYNYDAIIHSSGMYVSDDVRQLPENDREILSMQGVKALAILPLMYHGEALGFIGFDDCRRYRKWSLQELRFLQSITGIVTDLINRRNSEEQMRRGLETLQTVSDNTGAIVYVNDPVTYEVKFINRALSDALGVHPDDILGRKCWEVLQKGMTGPCVFCPMPYLYDEEGNITGKTYEWEPQNSLTSGWYWAKDAMIHWVDGSPVHIESAVDITFRKRYEQQLTRFASIDAMTGSFNREWGYKLMTSALRDARQTGEPYSLVFMDLDGLKKTNDTYGHAAGDEMIQLFVKAVRARVRKADMLCRWGGDEFLLMLGCDLHNAGNIVQNIRGDLDAVNDAKQHPFRVLFSFGIVDMLAFDSVDTAVTRADAAMYEDKMSKRR